MERRNSTTSKSSSLPQDYLAMVNEVFVGHFEASLKAYNQIKPNSHFEAFGEIFADEIVMAISLMTAENLSATTVYASIDFDPKATSNMQDLLAACVDAIGTIFGGLLSSNDVNALENLADESLSALEGVPFDWTVIPTNQVKVFVKLDKSNPKMDALADDFLKTHDPDFQERMKREQKEIEDLFVTGPRDRKGSDSAH